MVTNQKHQIGHYVPKNAPCFSRKRMRWIPVPKPPKVQCFKLHPRHTGIRG